MMDWNESYRGDGTDTTPIDEQLLARALSLEPGKALDLGCGAGGNAIGLAKRGWTVKGIDSASRAIASAKKSATEAKVDAEFEIADITEWKPDDVYDLVISSYALPPKGAERDAAFATAKAALAPRGMLIVGDWDAKNTFWGSPDIFVTVDEMKAAFDDLEIVSVESVETQPHDHSEIFGDEAHQESHEHDGAWVVIGIARRPLN